MVQLETAQPEIAQFDTGLDERTISRLYDTALVADGVEGFAAITTDDIEFFHHFGYLVIHHAFTPAEVDAALGGLLDLIDGKYPDFRGIQYEGKARELLPTLTADQKQDVVRKLMYFVKYDARLSALAEHHNLLDVVTRIMGETPELFQDQALLKPPLIGREKPWHQDNAYFKVPAETTVVGVWIALDQATPENGCMHIIPGSHREGAVVHWKRRDWQICDTDINTRRVVAVPLEPGGCLFFHGLLQHGTPPSQSTRRRRAVQYHYKPASVERISNEEHMAIFGSEGKDVTC